jgi:endogenous inhibitor of DNA gyrase (YacG/DUF329 family)
MVRAPTCPICDRELLPASITESPVFPFCSLRCKQVDLLRWCNGEYAVVDRLTADDLAEQMESSSDPDETELSESAIEIGNLAPTLSEPLGTPC